MVNDAVKSSRGSLGALSLDRMLSVGGAPIILCLLTAVGIEGENSPATLRVGVLLSLTSRSTAQRHGERCPVKCKLKWN